MGIGKGPHFSTRDIFIKYDFEEVTFRWDHKKRKIYVRFYGESEHRRPVPHDDPLFNEALRFGEEISQSEYQQGIARANQSEM